jgi:hypothetical protein
MKAVASTESCLKLNLVRIRDINFATRYSCNLSSWQHRRYCVQYHFEIKNNKESKLYSKDREALGISDVKESQISE